MSLSLKPYENLLRPAYEFSAAVTWTGAALVMMFVALFTDLPKAAFYYMGAASIICAAWRWRQTIKLWEFKINLVGKPFSFMRASMLRRLMAFKPKSLWLGFGFDWTPVHTQRANEIRKRDLKTILPPDWYLKYRESTEIVKDIVGLPWIHGIGDKEEHVFVPLSAIEGHTLVFGTTGAGKTRLYETIIVQAVLRNEVVIIIDPKGDKELRDVTQEACVLAGRPDAFLEFHPAFPSRSVRIDPLKNWNNPTELASRIAALMPSETGDSFTQMAWKAVNVVVEGLVYVDQMPNLMKLRRYIEGGAEKLLEEVLRAYFIRHIPRWETLVAPLVTRARDGKLPLKIIASAELLAYIHFYKNEVNETQRDQAVDGLLAMVEHNREHLGKILASLVPLLVMLTSGEIGKMLSPDPNDINDERPIFDTSKIIEGRHVLYLGLDSLSNATVGAAVGSVMLADLASVAGARYNYGDLNKLTKVQVIVDESAEVVNLPLVQILNKARGAGFVTTLAAQTLPDFIARMGNEARARQILGNCNNLIALRTKDRTTQDFIVETFGETDIQKVTRSVGSGSRTEDHGIDFTGNMTRSISEEKVNVFPAELLGMLQPLHYIAFMSGGRLIKGRLPKILSDR